MEGIHVHVHIVPLDNVPDADNNLNVNTFSFNLLKLKMNERLSHLIQSTKYDSSMPDAYPPDNTVVVVVLQQLVHQLTGHSQFSNFRFLQISPIKFSSGRVMLSRPGMVCCRGSFLLSRRLYF